MKTENQQDEFLICECGNDEHIMHWAYWLDDDSPTVYINVLLIPEYNIFKRIWRAIQYIFGHHSKYGYFDEFIVDVNDIPKFEKILTYLKRKKNGN